MDSNAPQQPTGPEDDAATAGPLAKLRLPATLIGLGLGALLALLSQLNGIALPAGLNSKAVAVAGVMTLMATLWILEVIPLAATSLLPLALFPLLGVESGKKVAGLYMNHIIVLLMGGFFMAKGLERWHVPQRMAKKVQAIAAGRPRALLYGLMGTTAFLSMWLSNTATTLVMITVALAAIQEARECPENAPDDVERFALALLLGVAYSANIGGLMTPVGTAPNAIMLGLYEKAAPGADPITFLHWMLLAAPVVALLLPTMAWLLSHVLCRFPADLRLSVHATSAAALPPMTTGAKRALLIFVGTAALWVFRRDVNLSVIVIPGWAGALGLNKLVDDGTVAMLGTVLMFACPAGASAPGSQKAATKERVLDWESARKIPWYLILLFGGGLALAGVFGSSGLSTWLGDQLVVLQSAPRIVVVAVLCLGMSLLTEVTSNTATTTLLLPVLAAASVPLKIPPVMLMWPATLCASAAFILPISTPPNAIAAGAGNISIPQMARVGVVLNMVAVAIITVVTMLWLKPFLGVP